MPRGPNKKNIKKVIDALREAPHSWTEIQEKTGIKESTLTLYLNDYLEYWGIAHRLPSGKWAYSPHFRELTEKEYELAVNHSLRLFTAEFEDGRRFRDQHPYKCIDMIIFHEQAEYNQPFLSAIYSHLTTGYSNKLRTEIKLYKDTITEIGLLRPDSFPILSSEIKSDLKDIPILEVTGVNYIGYTSEDIHIEYGFPLTVPKQTIQVLHELRYRILTDYLQTVFDLDQGIPLQGICDHCPKKHFKIA